MLQIMQSGFAPTTNLIPSSADRHQPQKHDLAAERDSSEERPDIARRIAKGRGQNEGADYKPWLTVREVASRGKSSRILGWKTRRVHTVLSGLEEHYFYVLEWSAFVVDVREQFPLLPLRDTLAIAESLGVRHPEHQGRPIVMTLDFLVTERRSERNHRFCARSTKRETDLADLRVREKLTIERLYCEAHGMDWGYVTEKNIPWTLAENVAYLHPRFDLSLRFPQLDAATISAVSRALADLVFSSLAPLNRHTQECDDLLGLAPGTALTIARHLLATRRWEVDMNQPLHPARPLHLLAIHDDAFNHQHAA